jgi:hypothetical protein
MLEIAKPEFHLRSTKCGDGEDPGSPTNHMSPNELWLLGSQFSEGFYAYINSPYPAKHYFIIHFLFADLIISLPFQRISLAVF